MKRNSLYLIAIILLGTLLRLFYLGRRPFDGDEGIMVLIANNNWGALLERASFDVHPPLYHLILKLFLNFGINEVSVRILSVLAGVGLVYLTYIFSKALFKNGKIALISGLLISFSSYLIYPSQEVRMYSLFAFFALASFCFFLSLIKNVRFKCWLAYIVPTVLMIYTHYLGFLVIFSQLIYFLFFVKKITLRQRSWQENKIWHIILSGIAIAVLFLPQLATMIGQFSGRVSEQSQLFQLSINLKSLLGAFYRLGAGRLFLDLSPENLWAMLMNTPWLFLVFLVTLLVPLVLFIKGLAVSYQKFRQQFWFLVIPVIIAIVVCLIFNEIGGKSSRYLIYIAPFYFIFLGIGFLEFFKKKWFVVIPLIFIIINLASLYHHYFIQDKAPGVNKIAEYIKDRIGKNEAVLIRGGFGGGESWAFKYYWQRLALSPKPLAIYDMLGEYKAGNLAKLKSVDPQKKAEELLQTYNHVWFYDMTYGNFSIKGEKHLLGKDKESKELILWEAKR